jgi:mono/diheme cytochrome c family protein
MGREVVRLSRSFRGGSKVLRKKLLEDSLTHAIRRICGAGVIITMGAFMLGCTAHKKPWGAETTLANVAKDIVIPLEAENRKNPVLLNPESLRAGKQIFVQSCALCHGVDGHGKTILGRSMYPPAMDLTSPHVQHWNDAEMFWVIQNGVRLTGMPSWKATLSEPQTWELVNFIHNLPRLDAAKNGMESTESTQAQQGQTKEGLIRYGRILYRQEGCFMCHRLDGEGGEVGPDLSVEGTRGRSEDWLIGHFKNPSAYTPGSIMPSFKNLTDEQLQALTAFLMNQKAQKSTQQGHK